MADTHRHTSAIQGPTGRADQLAVLLRADAIARARTTTVVALAGEAGIGKTHLLDARAAHGRESGAHLLRGASESAGMPPYLPFLEALGTYLRTIPREQLREQVGDYGAILAAIFPELPTRLGITFPLTRSPPSRRVCGSMKRSATSSRRSPVSGRLFCSSTISTGPTPSAWIS